MKAQALTQWNALERFLFPTRNLAKKASTPVFTDKGYIEKLSKFPPIHDSYSAQTQAPISKETTDMSVPVFSAFLRWFNNA